jgi:tetratricopeptide (TPR) repeat protein
MRKDFFIVILALFLISCRLKSSSGYLKDASNLEDRGKLREAIDLLNEAIEKDPKYLPAYINRGVDESILGNYVAAIRDYSAVIKLSPGNVLALVNRGRNENRLGKYREALGDFQTAINGKGGERVYVDLDIDGGYDCPMEEIRLERGVAYYNLDSLSRALRDFQFCISKQYQLGIAYRFRGYVYIAFQKKELGCNDLHQAAALGDVEASEDEKKFCP